MTEEEQIALNKRLLKAVKDNAPIEEIKALIEKGADVNAKDKLDQTALMLAATPELTEFFIKKGADVNANNIYGETALMYANTPEKTRLLIEAGANVNASTTYGETVLSFAKTEEQKALIKAAMQKKAEKEAKKRDLEKRRALHRKSLEVGDKLKERHSDEKVSDSTLPKKTAKIDKKRTITPKNEGRD